LRVQNIVKLTDSWYDDQNYDAQNEPKTAYWTGFDNVDLYVDGSYKFTSGTYSGKNLVEAYKLAWPRAFIPFSGPSEDGKSTIYGKLNLYDMADLPEEYILSQTPYPA
jgi:hypothetical protein